MFNSKLVDAEYNIITKRIGIAQWSRIIGGGHSGLRGPIGGFELKVPRHSLNYGRFKSEIFFSKSQRFPGVNLTNVLVFQPYSPIWTSLSPILLAKKALFE